MIKYNIYPSLLDAFEYYKQSPDEDAITSLIASINRERKKNIKPDKGTLVNSLVDMMAYCGGNVNTFIDGVLSVSKIGWVDWEFRELITPRLTNLLPDKIEFYYRGEVGEKESKKFIVNIPMLVEMAAPLAYSTTQLRVRSVIDTRFGKVCLYGLLDNIKENVIYDQKTTSRYEFPKYVHNSQHLVYPYCCIKSGIEVDNFQYRITDFRNVYVEEYPVKSLEYLEDAIRLRATDFIVFLEEHRSFIKDKKIFNTPGFEEIVGEDQMMNIF